MLNRSKLIAIIGIILAVFSLSWCVYRDIRIEKQFTYDLCNRVIGSRLQMDGISPYFYHWKPTDSIRYYDPTNRTTLKLSSVTATPFFHQLLYPIANLQIRTTSRLWLIFEYVAFLGMILLALIMAKERRQKWAVIIIGVLFLYSQAWTSGIALGQLYIMIPFVCMLFYFCINQKSGLINAAIAGILAMSLVLIRPNAVVFLLPFLFLAKQYTLKFKVVLLSFSALILLLAFSSGQSRRYWSDYTESVTEHVKYHQQLSPSAGAQKQYPTLPEWEGWSVAQIDKDQGEHPYVQNGENANVFVLIRTVSGLKVPVWLLSAFGVALISLLSLLFFKKYSGSLSFKPHLIAILGACFYMATDLLSPIHRIQYNVSQWIFPLLLLAMSYSSAYRGILVVGIIVGLLLDSLSYKLIPMQATIGEYLLFASVLGLLFTYKPQPRP